MFSKSFKLSLAVVAASPVLANSLPLPNFLHTATVFAAELQSGGATGALAPEPPSVDVAPEQTIGVNPLSENETLAQSLLGDAPPAPVAGVRIAQNDDATQGANIAPPLNNGAPLVQNPQLAPLGQNQPLGQNLQAAPLNGNQPAVRLNQNLQNPPFGQPGLRNAPLSQNNSQFGTEQLGPPAPERLSPLNGGNFGGSTLGNTLGNGNVGGGNFGPRLPFADPNRQFDPAYDLDVFVPGYHNFHDYRPVAAPYFQPVRQSGFYDYAPIVHPLPFVYSPISHGCY